LLAKDDVPETESTGTSGDIQETIVIVITTTITMVTGILMTMDMIAVTATVIATVRVIGTLGSKLEPAWKNADLESTHFPAVPIVDQARCPGHSILETGRRRVHSVALRLA
jgi:hypothetical protein